MILVVAKVNCKVKESTKTELQETIYENLLKGANVRKDLQIVEVIICSSSKQYEKNVDVEVFLNIAQAHDNADDKSFFYEGVVKGSVHSEGFVMANIETFSIDERVCKTFAKPSSGCGRCG